MAFWKGLFMASLILGLDATPLKHQNAVDEHQKVTIKLSENYTFLIEFGIFAVFEG